MKMNEVTDPLNVVGGHQVAQVPAQQQAPQPAQPKRMDGDYSMEDVLVLNPQFNPEDDESPEEISVTVTFNVEGENRAASWGYHGGEPAENVSAEIMSAYDENGVDIWDNLDPVVRDRVQAEADEAAEEIAANSDDGGDDYDDRDYDRYDESSQLDAIKKLSGLK